MRLATVTAVRPLEPLAMSLTDAAARRALDQATLENGCLWYLRGSADPSSEYLREKEDIQRMMDQQHKFEVDETTDGAFAFVAQPGDAVVHSTLVVHWSGRSNDTSKPRRAMSYFYWAASSGN